MTDRTVRVRLEAQTAQYESAMRRASQTTRSLGMSAGRVGGQMTRFGSQTSAMGNRLSFGVTLPLLAAGKQAVDTAIDFQKSMNTMAAVAKVPGPELEKLRRLAIKLGEDTVFSAAEAAQGQLELAKAGVSTADILGGALKNTLDLATAGDLDLATAATIAANAMNTFKLSGKQSQVAVDALAGAANASSADVYDLALALSQSGQAASTMGLDVAETTAILGMFADAGIKGSDAGTSLKTFLLSLPGNSGPAREAIRELGLEFFTASGEVKNISDIAQELQDDLEGLSKKQQIVALKQIFGNDAFRAANILMENGAKGLADYTRETEKQGNAVDVAKGKMKGLPGVVERLQGSIETFLLQLGDEQLEEVVKDVSGGIQDALKWFAELTPEMRNNIVKWTLLAAALGPVLKLVGGISSGLGGIIRLGGAAAGAIGKVAAAGTAGSATTGAVAGGGAAAAGGILGPLLAGAAVTVGGGFAYDKALDDLGVSLAKLEGPAKVAERALEYLPGFGNSLRTARGLDEVRQHKDSIGELASEYQLLQMGLFNTGSAARTYTRLFNRAKDITEDQAAELAFTIDTLDDMGRPLDATTEAMVGNLLAAGDWRSALKLLRGELNDAIGNIEKHRKGIDDAAGAVADHEQKVRSLTTTLGRVPGKTSSSIETPGLDKAIRQTLGFKLMLDALDGRTVSTRVVTVQDRAHQQQHSGGPAGSGSTRFGSNLRSDEYLTILQRGEMVLSRAEARLGGGGRGSIHVHVDARGSMHSLKQIESAARKGTEVALDQEDEFTRERASA